MRNIAILSLLIFFSGCMSFDVLDAELPKYKGRHIDDLVAKLGYPTAEQKIMGKTVYIWNTSSQFVTTTPTTSTSTGYVGSKSVNVTNTTYQTNVSQVSCTIRIFVDENNIVRNGDYTGNNGACFTYSRRLEKK